MLRFNLPPNWPAPPPGWTPGPGWQPDPQWPDPPVGWPLFTDDEPDVYRAPASESSAERSATGGVSVGISIVALVLAVVAIGVVSGSWLSSSWKAGNSLGQGVTAGPSVSELPYTVRATTTTSTPATSSSRGTWVGDYNVTGSCLVSLSVTADDSLRGTIDYCNGRCTQSWMETGRSGSVVYITDTVIRGSGCLDVQWNVTVQGDLLTATPTWRADGYVGPPMLLSRSR